ncbi:MAG: HXXEE domain-containing protein [Cyanothece sp. SIO2G6]|nr:HXXEE domain-containing protein [Cyanothece sp. SIO2G6]
MLWLPLGQHDFLIENWMKIGTYAVPFLLFAFFSSRTEQTDSFLADTKLMSVTLLVAYLTHQFEEHWVDLFGNQYAFYGYLNTLLLGILDAQDSTIILASQTAIFVINTSLVWLVGAIAIWRSPNHLFPTLAMNGIVLVNAISHILSSIIKQAYNPGLLTAIALFVPLAIAFYRKVLVTNSSANLQVIMSIIWAILAHIILIVGLLAANWFELIPEPVYFVVLVIWSVIPAFLFNSANKTSQVLFSET